MGNFQTPKKSIYLDYNSTTPMDERVFEAMKPYFVEKFGNASSKTHSFGWDADIAVENARKQISTSINCLAKEIFFTSGGTEANNLALSGAIDYLKEHGPDQPLHIITTQTEHKAVLSVTEKIERSGVEVSYLKCDQYGRVSLEQIKSELKPHTVLVSVIFGNNEIGTLNPIGEIGAFLTSQGILFHTDAVQAYGQIPVDVQKLNIDLMSLSAHKIYGPKGVGALFIRQMPKRVRLNPIIVGGGQEKEIRPGTLNVPGIVGFGKAAEMATQEMKIHIPRIQKVRDEMILELLKIPFVTLNGHPIQRLPNNISVTFEGIPNAQLLTELKDLALSTGSACTTGSTQPSHVLRALGLSDEKCMCTIRIGVGRLTTEDEAKYAVKRIKDVSFNLKERFAYKI
jgi:cysteine desulfurase